MAELMKNLARRLTALGSLALLLGAGAGRNRRKICRTRPGRRWR